MNIGRIAALAALSCVARPAAAAETDPAAAVRAAIAAQTAAWNRGDIDDALQAYCPHEDIVWINRAGASYGYAAFAEDMRRSYGGGPDAAARPGIMTNTVVSSRTLAPDIVVVALDWSVVRDGARVLGGISTQIWAPCAGRLRVVWEHAS